MSTHRILSPFEVAQPVPMGDTPTRLRMQLLDFWLADVVDGGIEVLYPERTCRGLTGSWQSEASGLSRFEMGIYALPSQKIHHLNATAIEPGVPEPLSRIHHNGGHVLRVIGYGVIDMEQEFEATFYQGLAGPHKLPSPDNYWVLQGVALRA